LEERSGTTLSGTDNAGRIFSSICSMEERHLLLLESAVTAIEEAAAAVGREVERDRLGESALARLSTVEAELRRSRLAIEEIIQEERR
jgi:hypothetical protein